MTNVRDLEMSWSWRGDTLVLVVAVTPPAIAAMTGAEPPSWARLVEVHQLTMALLTLLAAAGLYVQYRLARDRIVAWLCLAAALVGAQDLGSNGLAARRDGAGLLDGTDPTAVTDLALAGAVLAFALAARQRAGRPGGAPTRLILAGLLIAAHHVVRAVNADSLTVSVAILATGVAGTVLLLGCALGMLRRTIQIQLAELDRVHERLAGAEVDLREQSARLHEVGNSIGAIASATHLIHQRPDLAVPQRLRLEQMVDHEAARLARLLARQGQPVPQPTEVLGTPVAAPDATPVELDPLLEQLVVAQEAVGHPVSWSPGGLHAMGRADDVSEAVNILLDNSRKHAPGVPVRVTTRSAGDAVEIVVQDEGPGIPADLVPRLFEWGERSTSSSGQGIGLNRARQRLQESAATLAHVPTEVGTTFVVTLPALAWAAS